jgi:hypothetical protein
LRIELETLKAERGQAILADAGDAEVKRKTAAITAIEAALASLEDADTEAERRRREAENSAYWQERVRQIVELRAHEEKRLAAVSEAEKATRALAEALRNILAESATMRGILASLKAQIPDNLAKPEAPLSQRVSAIMATISPSHKHGFGGLKYGPPSFRTPEETWADGEKLDLSGLS